MIIVRNTRLKDLLLSISGGFTIPIYYAITKPEDRLFYGAFIAFALIFFLTIWYFNKALIITEKTLTFRTGMFSYKTFAIDNIDHIEVHKIHTTPIYLNIFLTTGEVVKITRTEEQVLQALEKWITKKRVPEPS